MISNTYQKIVHSYFPFPFFLELLEFTWVSILGGLCFFCYELKSFSILFSTSGFYRITVVFFLAKLGGLYDIDTLPTSLFNTLSESVLKLRLD